MKIRENRCPQKPVFRGGVKGSGKENHKYLILLLLKRHIVVFFPVPFLFTERKGIKKAKNACGCSRGCGRFLFSERYRHFYE